MKNEFITLFEAEDIKLGKPINFRDSDAHLFYPENFEYVMPPFRIKKMINVRVINKLIYRGLFLEKEVVVRKIPNLFRSTKNIISLIFKRRIRKSTIYWAANQWSENYFHWMTETLPALIAFKKFVPEVCVVLPKEYKKYLFIKHSLKIVGIKPTWISSRAIIISNILFAPELTKVGQYSTKMLEYMKKEILPKNNMPSSFRKIYISRRKATRRKVKDEIELENLLINYGFEIFCFEDLTWEMQINLMQQTRVLLSSHGAGMTNMIFMPQQGVVVELRSFNNDYNCFLTLAEQLGHSYYYFLCEADSNNHRDADIRVNLGVLKIFLEKLGMHEKNVN